MIEMRWVWHDLKNGSPPIGSINVGGLFQKLQYRIKLHNVMPPDYGWSEWIDVPHSGIKD